MYDIFSADMHHRINQVIKHVVPEETPDVPMHDAVVEGEDAQKKLDLKKKRKPVAAAEPSVEVADEQPLPKRGRGRPKAASAAKAAGRVGKAASA